jgi:hypothetical protein
MITQDNRSFFFNAYKSYHYEVAEKLDLLSDNGYSLILSTTLEKLLSENDWVGNSHTIALLECRGLYIIVGRRLGLIGFEQLPEIKRLFGDLKKIDFPKGYVMKENHNQVTVYHGSDQENKQPHRKIFVSEDKDFVKDYGKFISTYRLDTTNLINTLDTDFIEEFLPFYDHYDDTEITTVEEYLRRSSDTWEMVEDKADDIVQTIGCAGLIIYEGAVRNYLIYDTKCLTSIINEKVNIQSNKITDLRDASVKKPLEDIHIVLTQDGGAMIYYYYDGNIMPWSSKDDEIGSDNIYKTISRALDKTIQDDITSIRLSHNGGIVIEKTRGIGSWSGDRNRYSIDIKPVVERLLNLNIISPRTPVYIGNWAHRDEAGELLGSAARVMNTAPTPNKLILYHGTSNARLTEIMQNGLRPLSKETRVWSRDVTNGVPDHRQDSIYLTASMAQAEYYAKKATNVDRKRLSFRHRWDMKGKISKLQWQLESRKSYASDTEISKIQEQIDKLNTALELLDRMNRAVDKAEPVILKIELTRKDYKYLMADDDYIHKQNNIGQTVELTDWRNSLSDFGQVAYRGVITPDRITRIL